VQRRLGGHPEAGQLGNSPNLSAILAIFEKLYFRFIFVYAVAGEGKAINLKQNTVGYHGNQRLGTGRLWLGSNSK
jgi:hypothetical protein